MIKASLNMGNFKKKCEKLQATFSLKDGKINQFMEKRAIWQIQQMRLRTLRAVGTSGGPFPELNPEYALYKEKKGRQGIANLSFTGKYLASFGYTNPSLGVFHIGAGIGNSVKTHAYLQMYLEKGTKRQKPRKPRPHFGFSESEKKAFNTAIKDFQEKLIHESST